MPYVQARKLMHLGAPTFSLLVRRKPHLEVTRMKVDKRKKVLKLKY